MESHRSTLAAATGTDSYDTYLLHLIVLPDPPLHRRPLRNPIDPLQQTRELTHLLLRKTTPLPAFHPRPGLEIRNADGSFAAARKPVAWFTRVFAREADLENAEDA